jgi:phosphatidylserine decarboxylase
MRNTAQHQYIERETSRVRDEKIFGHQLVDFIYSDVRENAGTIFRALTSARITSLLAYFYYDCALGSRVTGTKGLFRAFGVDLSECIDAPRFLDTARKVFERKIKYWQTRPMPDDTRAIVSPSDSKMLLGSFSDTSRLFLKDKFFEFEELLGTDKKTWLTAFRDGDFAVFRLTPEKYHYNHAPVTGKVLDVYQIPGAYHSCSPEAVITIATPYSKNKRVITIIDTDVEGGTHAGLVAMVEVVALLIGDIVQCYSEHRYNYPQWVTRGMFLNKGQPKSLYRPGSSTNVLIFQKGRVEFSEDLIENMHHCGARSIFTSGFGRAMVETEVKVRSGIAMACEGGWPSGRVFYGR